LYFFRKRIGVVSFVVEHAKKNYFHTRKKFIFSITTRVRSRLAYSEDAPFPICFLFFEMAQGIGKREYADIKE
jgi:hypothetical protein